LTTAYVDTSCLVAIALREPDWERVATALERFERLVSSNLLEAELRSALAREEVPQLAVPLLEEVSWILPPRPLTREIQRVAREGYVRGADLWHLACALFLAGDAGQLTFATLDRRQSEVAMAVGFPPLLPEHPT
jgi:uncharacterized protein with PIN domain